MCQDESDHQELHPNMSTGGEMLQGILNWPTVTVVVPTKDRPELLQRCVRAILSQDYPGHIDCLIHLRRN